ncbi:hypothetical protein FALBO_11326 [Fusarium albosuccineum]|uniref:Uncharacterized protein n=1 Tax=Fusarium albosuccineum TaxID=1237068 RepID=A0A8H4PHX2_9HYPO|nr:hypothetical protein FALBO_11326 [Fusarium albosuccineum]
MRCSLLFLAPLVLLSELVAAENTIEQICGGVKGILGCKASFDIPVSAKLKTCPNKFFEVSKRRWDEPPATIIDFYELQVDPCKTRYTYKYPCPTWRKPGRMCDGWTCTPGTNTKWIDVPCGITVITKRMDLCQSVRDTLGSAASDFINKASAMCSCIPRAFEMIGTGLLDSISTKGGLANIDSKLITELVQLQKCIVDNGFGIKDDKYDVVAKDLTSKDGWVVLRAAELSEVLLGWIDIFGRIKTKVAGIADAAENLVVRLESVPGKVEAIEKKNCQNKACVGPGASDFVKKVAKAVATVQSLRNIRKAADTAANAVPKLVDRAEMIIKVADSIPGEDFIIKLITSGSLTKIDDIIEAIQITKELPKAAAELQAIISPIGELASGYQTFSADALKVIEEVISVSWEDYRKEFEADVSGQLQAGLTEIQTLVRTELDEPLRNLMTAIKDLTDVLDLFPIKDGLFELDTGVSSYKRWSAITMDVPCTKAGRANFEISGFKTSFDYPKFYSCQYGPKRIPWPNHHIPYIKFRIG